MSRLAGRSFRTAFFVFVSYAVCAAVGSILAGWSLGWLAVLAVNYLIVCFCAFLARYAADDDQQEPRTEALAIGIGTIASVGTQALQYGLQLNATGAAEQVRSASVLGAAIYHWGPNSAPIIYTAALAGWTLAGAILGLIGAQRARKPQAFEISHWLAILLLTGSTLLVLPWLSGTGATSRSTGLTPIDTLLHHLVIALVMWTALAGASWRFRRLFGMTDLIGPVARKAGEVARGVAVAILGAAVCLTVLWAVLAVGKRVGGHDRVLGATAAWTIVVVGLLVILAFDLPAVGRSMIVRALAVWLSGLRPPRWLAPSTFPPIVRSIARLRTFLLERLAAVARTASDVIIRIRVRWPGPKPLGLVLTLVLMLSLIALVLAWPPQQPRQTSSLPPPSGVPKAITEPALPAQPQVMFEEAPIACLQPDWVYGQSDRVTAAVRACRVSPAPDILIAIGSATREGKVETELLRSKRRGQTLAKALLDASAYIEPRPDIYILDLGIQSRSASSAASSGPPVRVLAGTITPAKTTMDLPSVARDLSTYLASAPRREGFSTCTLTFYGGKTMPRETAQSLSCPPHR